MKSDDLKDIIRKLARGPDFMGVRAEKRVAGVDVSPGCAFGALLDQRLADVEQSLDEMKTRLNGLIFLLIGTVLVEVIMRLVR